ncbi:MAG: hypothetical protein ABIH34_03100 [Nanoarchaeota archaeon]
MWWSKKRNALAEARRLEQEMKEDIPLRDINTAHTEFNREVMKLSKLVSRPRKKSTMERRSAKKKVIKRHAEKIGTDKRPIKKTKTTSSRRTAMS